MEPLGSKHENAVSRGDADGADPGLHVGTKRPDEACRWRLAAPRGGATLVTGAARPCPSLSPMGTRRLFPRLSPRRALASAAFETFSFTPVDTAEPSSDLRAFMGDDGLSYSATEPRAETGRDKRVRGLSCSPVSTGASPAGLNALFTHACEGAPNEADCADFEINLL